MNKKYSEGNNIPYPSNGDWSDYIELGFVPDKIIILAEQASTESNFMGIYEDGHFYVNAKLYSYVHDYFDDGTIEIDGSKFRINGFSTILNGGTFSYIAVADIPILPPLPVSKLIFDGKVYGSVIYGGGDDMIDYSTEEQKTGQKWIDGKDIYQKTFEVDNPVAETEVDVDANVDNFIRLFGTMIGNDNAIIDISTYFNSSYNAAVQYLSASNKLNFQIVYSGGISKAYVTIQYTKTE